MGGREGDGLNPARHYAPLHVIPSWCHTSLLCHSRSAGTFPLALHPPQISWSRTFLLYVFTRDILKIGTLFQNLDISTNNLTYVLCIRKLHFLVQLKVERDKEHFRYLLLWFEKSGCWSSPIYLKNFWVCFISWNMWVLISTIQKW